MNTTHGESDLQPPARFERAFLVTAALLFCTSALATLRLCNAMSDMPGMPMPGGWHMSMAWMRMPGQGWDDAAAAFLAMWCVMMVAMMSPALLPMLRRYHRGVGCVGDARLAGLTALVAGGYFAVWAAVGAIVYVCGVALAAFVMASPALSHAVPLAIGLLAIAVGALQFGARKQRRLVCCERRHRVAADGSAAWKHGLRIGLHCVRCCAGFTLLLLVFGVMDLLVMAIVTIAITAERLAPARSGVAQALGVATIAVGAAWSLRAAGLV
ncbi:DUF2182 domain-containing protein [Tahibacter sp.]|uniref:DUF2182 domain-containing protein n=1 Tax=Tahibacter sp. TaxID=2056211 RepID=UPI002D7E6F45|nr:DUF2182 domain-containing protein [Tahibacter sp.]